MANEVNNAGKACKRLMPGPLRRPGPSKRARMVLQRDEQTGQALEGLLHVQHAFSDGSSGGEVHHEAPAHLNGEGKLRHEAAPHLLPKAMEVNGDGEVQRDGSAHSQPKAKEVNGDGEVQPVVLSNLQSHAKLCKGDGEVQLVVLTNLQSQAKLSKCDGEEQPVLLTNLQSQAKLFMGDGEEQPVVLSDLQSQANLAKPWPRFGLWCRMRQECPSCCGGRSGGRAPGGLEAASAGTAWPAGV